MPRPALAPFFAALGLLPLLSCGGAAYMHPAAGPRDRAAPDSGRKRAAADEKSPRSRDDAPSAPGGTASAAPAEEADARDYTRSTSEDAGDEPTARPSPKPSKPAAPAARPPARDGAPGILPPPPPPPTPAPAAAGVKAGASDDNLAFNAFLRFLDQHRGRGLREDIERRVVIKLVDVEGRPVPDAKLTWTEPGQPAVERTTYADGRTLVFASPKAGDHGATVRVEVPGGETVTRSLQGARRQLELRLSGPRAEVKKVPLDVAFVLDTTGSMDDEIVSLKRTLEAIHFQISNLSPRPDVRFGMVLFRDRGDDYVTRLVPFTSDLKQFAASLATVDAGGGGDYPEDVQEGLHDALEKLEWRDRGVRLAFLIGDAPPHLDYGQPFDYLVAAREAARRGIKITSIGASGLSVEGEVVWRQLAQYTMAPFVFLTYGEKGDTEGTPSSVSHHVGSNWVADDLDAIVVRMVKSEVAHYSPRGAPKKDDYFSAESRPGADGRAVLDDLFRQSVRQLTDYALERIDPRTPTVLLPITARPEAMGATAERLGRQLSVALGTAGPFQLVEDAGRQALLDKLAEQLGDAYDVERAAEAGKLVPARLAVFGQLDGSSASELELLVKLVRLETGEVLSLSLLKIDRKLL